MVIGISSLQPKAWTFVFCQFTSSPRDAVSLAIVSSMGTRSLSSSARRETSSAKSRSVKELWPNATPIEQDSTVLSSNQSMSVQMNLGPAHSPGKHQPRSKPWAVSLACPNTANRVVIQHSKESHNLIRDTMPIIGCSQTKHNDLSAKTTGRTTFLYFQSSHDLQVSG